MMCFLRSGVTGRRLSSPKIKAFAVIAAISAGGCSADIARFDFPSANLNEPTTGAIPAPTEPVGGPFSLGASDLPNETAPPPAPYDREVATTPPADQRINVTALPPPPAAPAPQPSYATDPAPVAAAQRAFEEPAPMPVASEERGQEIEVQRGDTLYGLSRRHNVSLNELMRVNGLTSPALKPGQKLALPSGKVAARPSRPAPVAIAPAAAPADWSGSYTIQSGDSLYGIARQYNVKTEDLQRYNGITDPRRVRPGTVLRIPGVAGAALAENQAVTSPSPGSSVTLTPPQTAPVTSDQAPLVTGPAAQPTILNSQPAASEEKKVAALDTQSRSDASSIGTPASGSVGDAGKLRWPVKGRIITAFGARTDGTHNDGINISVPIGTDIHAAESGVVAYAGSELKGYGNLVLLRHDNGWVTAYAHADELHVKRGDKVTRGQVIGKAGKTGQVDRPQLHFEVRHGQKPVDPTPYLEKL